MSFKREYNKTNRGLRCRCSTGECWVLGVVLSFATGGRLCFWGFEGSVYRNLTGGCARRRRRRRSSNAAAMMARAHGGNTIFLSPWQPHKNLPPTQKKTLPIITNPPPLPLFLQMVPPPRHQKNDRRTLPRFGPVHLARRTHRFLRLV